MMKSPILDRAERFLSTHARPLERAVFARRFRGGPAEPVLAALRAFRNPDGGFGRALEPDVRAPDSMALHAEIALRTLAAAEIRDTALAGEVCGSLAAQAEPSGRVPIVDRAAVAKHPHAPHWGFPIFTGESPNPTAALVGHLRAQGAEHPWLDRAEAWCWERLASLDGLDAHEISCGAAFAEHARDRERARPLAEALARALESAEHYRRDPDAKEYGLSPLRYCPTPRSIFREAFPDALLHAHLAALARDQQPDGGWAIAFPTAVPEAVDEWRGVFTIDALTLLAAWERL